MEGPNQWPGIATGVNRPPRFKCVARQPLWGAAANGSQVVGLAGDVSSDERPTVALINLCDRMIEVGARIFRAASS